MGTQRIDFQSLQKRLGILFRRRLLFFLFQVGESAQKAERFLLCFFPILLNAILGFTSLKKEHNDFALSTGADPLTVFWKVRLPAALPQIFVGLKWAAVNATVGATIGEWIGGDAGLGYYIQMASGDMKMDVAFAIIVMLAFLGLFLYYLVVVFEKILVPWHVSQRPSVSGLVTTE